MVDIPDSLRSVFSGTVSQRDGSYVLEVPASEIEHEALAVDEAYRVAMFGAAASENTSQSTSDPRRSRESKQQAPTPPVDEGDVREVTIEATGDQGDGIAKVERGYVIIVPDARPGEQPTIEVEQVRQNVAFAKVVEDSPQPP